MDKNVEVIESGLHCDNEKCDYTNSIKSEDYPQWINEPCPKCGENLLTEEDYENSVILTQTMDYVNALTEDEINLIAQDMFSKPELIKDNLVIQSLLDAGFDLANMELNSLMSMTVNMHKGISIENIKLMNENGREE